MTSEIIEKKMKIGPFRYYRVGFVSILYLFGKEIHSTVGNMHWTLGIAWGKP